MLLNEFIDKNQFADSENDSSIMHLRDLRKTRLTLAQLNKLRSIREIKNLEMKKKVESVRRQYKTPAQAPGF
jgi:hypothetical protein